MGICVAGMHRSGTSMVIRLLNECGVYLGNAIDLVPPSPDNEEGHWENRHFVDVNDRILSALGGGWDFPPKLETGWPERPELSACHDDASRLAAQFDRHRPWAWKDPRSSLTIPFWESVISDLRVVICLRHPLEVADSLNRRSFNSPGFGLNLWHEYNRAVLEATRPERRIVTHYDAYFVDPRQELTRMLCGLGLKVSAETIDRACATVSGRLRHNQRRDVDLGVAAIPPKVVSLYEQMCREAERPTTRPTQLVDLSARPDVPAEVQGEVPNPTENETSSTDSRWLDHLRNYTARLSYQVNDLTRELRELRQMEIEQHRLAEYLKVSDRKAQLADEMIQALLDKGRPIERILVVKTSAAGYVGVVLGNLRSLFPAAILSVWTEERESEEFSIDLEIDRVVLYRNLGSIPDMTRELAKIDPDLLVIQSTREPTYAKMQFLAATLLRRSWLVYVYDERAKVEGALHLASKFAIVARTAIAAARPLGLLVAAYRLCRRVARVVAFPFVLAGLLLGAARHGRSRSAYLRRRTGVDAS